jgi:hypothetical protein
MKDSQHTSVLLVNVPKLLKSTPLPSLTQLVAGSRSSNKFGYAAQSYILTCMPCIPCILFHLIRLQWTSSTACGSPSGGQRITPALQQSATAALRDRDKYRAAICTPATLFCRPASTRTGTSQANHAVPAYPQRCCMGTLSGCYPGIVSCLCPPGIECSSCAQSGLCVQLLCAVAGQGRRAAGVAWSGHSLP